MELVKIEEKYVVQGWVGGAWLETTDRFPAGHTYDPTPEGLQAARDAAKHWQLSQLDYDSDPRARVVRVTVEAVVE